MYQAHLQRREQRKLKALMKYQQEILRSQLGQQAYLEQQYYSDPKVKIFSKYDPLAVPLQKDLSQTSMTSANSASSTNHLPKPMNSLHSQFPQTANQMPFEPSSVLQLSSYIFNLPYTVVNRLMWRARRRKGSRSNQSVLIVVTMTNNGTIHHEGGVSSHEETSALEEGRLRSDPILSSSISEHFQSVAVSHPSKSPNIHYAHSFPKVKHPSIASDHHISEEDEDDLQSLHA